MSDMGLADQVRNISWYHTLELPGGVVTPGHYDLRRSAHQLPIPKSLAGKRCLDVGTSDGFWAFEMERRGAAEVVAVDIDDPARYDWPEPVPRTPRRPANQYAGVNRGFTLAHRALGSKVKRIDISVYDLASENVGTFDFAFMGALLLHLRDPVRAFSAIRGVVGGEFLSADVISLWATVSHPRRAAAELVAVGQPRWWTPNILGHRRLLSAAGFQILRAGGPYFLPFGVGFDQRPSLRELTKATVRRPGSAHTTFHLLGRRLGAPCAWALCRPGPSGAAASG